MITKFNNYIKEQYISDDTFATEISIYMHSLLPDNTNVELVVEDSNMITLRDYNDNIILTLSTIDGSFYYEDCNNTNDMRWENLKDFKDYIKTCLDNFYDELKYTISYIKLDDIPILDEEKYSNYIYNLIIKDPKYIKQIKTIEDFLNKETLDKLKHLINANNFDLI